MTDRPDWRGDLRRGARSIRDLVARGIVPAGEAAALGPVVDRFGLLVPAYYLGLIDREDPACPIRRQVVPDLRELLPVPGELADPIGDAAHERTPILVHRYPDRALLLATHQCPVVCRFCFRKVRIHGDVGVRLRSELPAALEYLRAHPGIREVVLSGGDPLLLGDGLLAELLSALRTVPSVRVVRIHTRTLATLPARVTPELVSLLAAHRPLMVVGHYNHPKELTNLASEAMEALLGRGVPVLSQTVLLRGVNDRASVLEALLRGLHERMVRPYYLHHPDLVVGSQHLRVSLERGLALVRSLRGRLSGLALPLYVLDIPGGLGKVPVDSAFVVRGDAPGRWQLTSPFGPTVPYLDLAAGDTVSPTDYA